MVRTISFLVIAAVALGRASAGELRPARGEFLVSTEQTDGGIFAQTVILLLSYDDAGAAGLVVNRPTDVKASELFSGESPLSAYDGTIYWGGPVQMDTLLALSNTDRPPDGAEKILDSVYVVPFSEDVIAAPGVRLFIGYTGWAAGQLDSELARGSWQLVPASGDGVFSKDPAGLWKRLLPRETYRAGLLPHRDSTLAASGRIIGDASLHTASSAGAGPGPDRMTERTSK